LQFHISGPILIVTATSITIEYNKDDPLQERLERCPWGILPAERYPDFAVMHAELNKALKED
jgi:hypothetical protein